MKFGFCRGPGMNSDQLAKIIQDSDNAVESNFYDEALERNGATLSVNNPVSDEVEVLLNND
jgi:hypothetical protein